MKKIIATSKNYNSLQILRSITYYYEDGTSAIHEVGAKKKPIKPNRILGDLIDKKEYQAE